MGFHNTPQFYTHMCTRCLWTGTVKDMDAECVDRGDRYQPPEWHAKCPDCGAVNTMEEVQLCISCRDANQYTDEDGQGYYLCFDCLMEGRAAKAESQQD